MECFTIMSNEIEGRIDPFYYRVEFRRRYKEIEKSKYQKAVFEQVITDLKNGVEIRTYSDDGYRYLRVTDLSDDGINDNNPRFVKVNSIPTRIKLTKNDFLISRSGSLGLVSVVNEKVINSILSSHIFKISLDTTKVNPKYLECFLRTSLGQFQFFQKNNGGIVPEINQSALKSIKIILPPLSVQTHIVQLMDNAYNLKKSKETQAKQLLDSINDYVLSELGIKLPELKDKMIYVVYSDDVKGKRIDAYYYQPKFEEVEKAIERGKFEVKELKEFIEKLTSGQRPKGGVRQINEGIPSLGGEHILSNGTITTSDLKFIPVEFHKKQLKSKVRKKDILIVKDGATTGKVGIIPEDYPFEEANINEHVFLLRVKKDINPYYIFSILKSPLGQIQIKRDITGGTIMGIIRETTKNLKIPLPPLKIQNKIAEEVKRRMQKAEKLQKEAKEVLEKAKQEVEKIILS